MKPILSGSRGLAGVALVFVIAWALVAVLLLTGTLVTAHQINRDVHLINPRLTGIDLNTRQVRLADRTRALSGRIRAAAAPLSGELAGTVNAAQRIQQTADQILSRARSINGTAGLIHGRVLGIGATVASIGSEVQSIHASVAGIGASVTSVDADVGGILASADSIHSSVDGVLVDARGILAAGGSIVTGVRAINAKAVTIQGLARTIGGNLAAVFGDVGSGNAPGTVDGHANAIDCSMLLNTTLLGGPTAGCGN